MHLKNGKKLHNERGITFFHETERYVNDLNVYNRSKNRTNLWDDLIHACVCTYIVFSSYIFVYVIKDSLSRSVFISDYNASINSII